MSDLLNIGLAQIAPVWFDRAATIEKVCGQIEAAASAGCDIAAFGEALIPGYPFWLEYSHITAFDDRLHKSFHSIYMDQAVCIEDGDLDAVCQAAREGGVAVYIGIIERPLDRGGKSLYASLVYIGPDGEIGSVHRKLMPTYDERLTWSFGDGYGLRTHRLGAFTVGGLNCWENWMPLTRAALYAQGEDLHFAVWPGSKRNTEDITRFIARESRSYVVSVSSLMRKSDLPSGLPNIEKIIENAPEFLADGGSCVAGPDGKWVVEPSCGEEKLIVVEGDHARVREEWQNFDPAGHYSRPDVLHLRVDRTRQSAAVFIDETMTQEPSQ